MNGPLSGVKIVDLSSVVMGPFATQILADLGADVIKVESPEGDTMRNIGPSRTKGMAPNYLNMNRNKRSIVLDLRRSEALAALKRLIVDADVFFSNLRPAAMERLGLGYAEVARINSRVIYAMATGFGESGRYAGKPAFDDLIQGAVAIPSLMQSTTGTPQYLPTNMCDRVTGLTAVYAVTSALFARERSGRGQAVEIPMMETMAQFVLSDHMFGATFEPPLGEPGYSRLLVKGRAPFKTRDGYVCALVYLDKHWNKFCDIIGHPAGAADPRFANTRTRTENVDAFNAFIAQQMAKRTSAEWMDIFTEADLPIMPMHTVATLLDDPHLNDVKFFSWMEHPTEGRIRSMGIPTAFSDTPATVRRHAPLLGENTRDILQQAGFSSDEIGQLIESGAARDAQNLT